MYGVWLSSVSPATKSEPRTKLDRDQVVEIALRVADTEGLEAVTIRRLAQELSVTPMALYWHFKDKDSLLAALADRIWQNTLARLQTTGELTETDPWTAMRAIVAALLGAMREHPALARRVPYRVLICEAGLVLCDRALALLAVIGFDAAVSSHVATFLLNGVVMLVDSQPGVDVPEVEARAEAMRQKRLALAALPPGRFPRVTEAAEYLTDCDQPDAHFSVGVSLLMGGLRHQASLLASPA
jgi:TetR/AcrR family transcriptional regulator, tetracycline repressor protein